jgi:hypothetical protein
MADLMLLVPLIMYMVIDDTNSWGSYHQTYINMLWSAYAPLGISWFIVLADDSQAARTQLTGAIEMAGLGPMALLWVGWATFMMSTKSAGAMVTTNLGLFIWAIVYPVVNILLIIMHYHMSPPMYAWLAVAPMRANPIDSAKPWNDPSMKAAAPAPAAAIEIPAIEIPSIEVEAPTIEVEAPSVEVEAEAPSVEVDADVSADASVDADVSADVSIDADADFE